MSPIVIQMYHNDGLVHTRFSQMIAMWLVYALSSSSALGTSTQPVGTASPVGQLPLLEASGAVAGSGFPEWQAVTGSPLFCPGAYGNAAVIVLVSGGQLATLVGPTPHTIKTSNLTLPNATTESGQFLLTSTVWAQATAADFDGDGTAELVLVPAIRGSAGGADMVVVSFSADCSEWHVVFTAIVPMATTPSTVWTGVAAGVFSEPAAVGTEAAPQSVLLLGDASPQIVLVGGQNRVGTVVGATDPLGKANAGWQRIAAGEMTDPGGDGTGPGGGVVLTRDVGAERVVVLIMESFPTTSVLATSDLASVPPGTTQWLHPGVGTFFGDGRGTAVLVGITTSTSTPIVMTLALNASAALSVESTCHLDAGAWAASALAPVLGSSVLSRPGEIQLVGLRGTTAVHPNFPVNLLVYGRAEHFLARRAAVAGTLSQYGFDGTMNVTVPIDTDQIKQGLTITHANTHSFIACDSVASAAGTEASAEGYLAFVRLLAATADFVVGGEQLRMWLTLLPPTEAVSGKCQPPPDSPLTPFNETAIFSSKLGYLDYGAWAAVCGKLAMLYPHFVALQIDDMSHDVQPPAGIFTPDLIANMTSGLRAHAPWVNLISTTYYTEGGFVWTLWPDLPKVVDTVLFYFRNQKEGAGPCSNPVCPWGPRMKTREGGCLAGNCSEATAQNAAGEIADIAAGMPPGRPLQVGFYATGHSSLGSPTARYVRMVMNGILAQGNVAGITFYRMHVPPANGCVGPAVQTNMGCVVAEVFSGLNDRSKNGMRAAMAARAARRADL